MNNKETSINYYQRIQSLLPQEKFRGIRNRIAKDSNEQLEVLWNIIVAGYPVDFALSNYKQLHAYLNGKSVDYADALTSYSVKPELYSGIDIPKTKWFELN